MEPVLTPAEMAAVDAAAPEPLDVLIDRAGRAVARAALDMLGQAYGRRVLVLAGKGNNGADGVVAARVLGQAGVRCEVGPPGTVARHRPDLVIDACVGTGLGRPFEVPPLPDAPVLAVDIPSGVDGLTGAVAGGAIRAERTLTFAALKPGLLLGGGSEVAGTIEVADIGLDIGSPSLHLVTDADAAAWPARQRDDHKWRRAVWCIGGRPGMPGALSLAAEATARAGAGYVAVSTPGGSPAAHRESVTVELSEEWGSEVAADADRFAAFVIGPGLDPSLDPAELRRVIELGRPTVVDASGLDLLAEDRAMVADRPVVLTPHDGEFRRLFGAAPGPDRVAAARAAAAELGATVLLKGPTTVVAAPDGAARLVTSGDARLATAGTGDVLAGIIGAGLAGGLAPLDAAALGAHLHGRAAAATGLEFPLASDLLRTI